MRKQGLGLLAAAALVAGVSFVAQAAVPELLTQQGRLLDADGAPVDGETSFVFTIYDAAEDGTELWTETQPITLADGYFSARLGDVEALDASIFDGSTLYLGIKVGADDEMTPRQPLVSVPYALVANDATGDINPTSVTVGGQTVIDSNGNIGNVTIGGTFEGTLGSLAGFQTFLTTRTASATNVAASATAACPANHSATGGGCAVTNANGLVKLDEPTLSGGRPTGWTCNCQAETGNCTVKATAVCVNTQ